MSLFNTGVFRLHSGDLSNFKIDCDALTDEDLQAVADVFGTQMMFGEIVGIPTGGNKLADCFVKWIGDSDILLIVDDVLTTGTSMYREYDKAMQSGKWASVIGFVIFARGKVPDWVFPMFQMPSGWDGI
jgi:hypothetical protein